MKTGDTLLSRYRIRRPLGRGASATAFLADDLVWNQVVALKLLHTTSPRALRTLRFEFDTLRCLAHPNLARVHDLCTTTLRSPAAVQPFYTADFIDGSPLVAERPWHDVEPAVVDVLEALGTLHDAGIRHGDLKPDNILVRDGRATLIDLSCAAPLGASDGSVSGTPAFMAPEVRQGARADGRADLYSLGKLIELSPDPPTRIRSIIAALTNPDPNERPSDVDEVLETLGKRRTPRHPVSRCLGRLGGRRSIIDEAIGLLDDLVSRRPGPRVLHVSGFPGAGTSRVLREIKAEAQMRAVVVEGNTHHSDAVTRLLLSAVVTQAPCTSVSDIVDVCDALATHTPVVLVLDDVDALDTSQRSLLEALVRSLTEAHCALLVTSGAPDVLPRTSALRELRVEPLTRSEVDDWIGDALPTGRVDALMVSTSGLPSRIEDTLRRLATGALPESELETNRSEVESHGERLTRVEPRVRRAAVLASLAGTRLSGDELRALAIGEEVQRELVRIGWLMPDGATWRVLPPSESVLSEEESAPLHEQLAAWHEQRARVSEGSQASRMRARRAEHLALAGRCDDAIDLLEEEPDVHVALDAWERAATVMADARDSLAIHLRASQLQRACGRTRSALARLERCRLDQDDAQSWYSHRHELGACHAALGDTARARELLQIAYDAAPSGESKARIAVDLSTCLNAMERYRDALVCVAGVVESCADPVTMAKLLEAEGIARCYLGELDESKRSLQAAADALNPLGRPRDAVRAAGNLALVAFRMGDLDRAARGYSRALELAESQGHPDQVSNAALNHGTVLHQQGHWGPAQRAYQRGMRIAVAAGRTSTESALCFNLAKVYGDIGSFDRAREMADRCEALTSELGTPVTLAAVHAVRAEIAAAAGDVEGAWRHVERARQGFREHGDESELAQVDLQAAALDLDGGNAERAVELLERASEYFRSHPERDIALQVHWLRGKLAMTRDATEGAAHAQRMADEAAALRMLAEEAMANDLLADAFFKQSLTTLGGSHRTRARELWERIASELPAPQRAAFWRHPRRRPATPEPASESSIPSVSRRIEKLERLLAINKRINSTLRTRQVLEQAMDAAIDLTGAERGFLLLRKVDNGLDVAVARNLDREKLEHSELKFSRAIAEEVVHSGEPILTDNAQLDDRFRSRRSVHAMGLRSVVCVPAVSPEGVLGALYLDNRFAKGRFSEHDVELLAALADQVAIALTNARLMQELKHRNRELEQERERVNGLLAAQAEEIDRLQVEVRDHRAAHEHRYDYSRIVGQSDAMRAVFSVLDRVIETSVPVLIRGESGTGKELVARAIHESGARKTGPWVSVNCGALPQALLESELFGHVRGAFTGADRDREGLLVRGSGGTVFLDELGEMSPSMQVKLLRVLQELEVRPVGSNRIVPIDCRFVCATNRDLGLRVEQGAFREDLYYRVAVIEILLPPLRERLDDIPLLCAALLDKIAQRVGRPAPGLTQPALRKLMEHDWPGNVRQLENVLTKAVVLSDGDRIRPAQLSLPASNSQGRSRGSSDTFSQREKRRIQEALETNRWNVTKVSELLAIPRATLYRKLRRYGLERGWERD